MAIPSKQFASLNTLNLLDHASSPGGIRRIYPGNQPSPTRISEAAPGDSKLVPLQQEGRVALCLGIITAGANAEMVIVGAKKVSVLLCDAAI